MLRFHLLLVGLLIVIALGCGGQEQAALLDDASIRELAELPGARQSSNIALREEITRLEQAGTTPLLLGISPSDDSPEDSHDAGIWFVELFGEKNLEALDRKSDELVPRPTFQVGPIQLERIHRFTERYEPQQRQVREWLSGGPAPFRVELERGWFADTSFISAVAIAVRLETFGGLEQLATGQLDEAANSLENSLQLCERLAASGHLNARLTAAQLRGDCLQLLSAIVEHPEASSALAERLVENLRATLARWPSEAACWKADRAVGMHGYEVIRTGNLLLILTPEEIEQFATEHILRELENAARRSLDTDELFYLDAMRRIIASCDAGGGEIAYHARREVVREILRELDEKKSSSDFPLIAARLLLPSIDAAQIKLAIDRARCEAWLLALSAATAATPPGYQRSPVTGQPYKIEVEANRIVVRDFEGAEIGYDTPVIVPRFDVRVSRLP